MHVFYVSIVIVTAMVGVQIYPSVPQTHQSKSINPGFTETRLKPPMSLEPKQFLGQSLFELSGCPPPIPKVVIEELTDLYVFITHEVILFLVCNFLRDEVTVSLPELL